MRKYLAVTFLSIVASFSSAHAAAQNYNAGNFILGIGIGAGSPHIAPVGGAQLTINPSVELIIGSWRSGIALGVTVDSSINFLGPGLSGSLAPMLTFHWTLAPKIDWYTSLGMGLQLMPVVTGGTKGIYTIHVGFQTGFNFVITPLVLLNVGMAIHADQIFGSAGVKFRFGSVSALKERL